MRVVVGAHQRVLLIRAAVLPDRARLHQLPVERVAILEASGRHAARRPHAVRGLIRERDAERPVFAAEKAGRRERLQLLAFADVDALADVDERRHRRIERPERARDDRAEVRRGHRLRRRVAGVPLILMPRVQDEPEIARLIAANQRPAIHHLREMLEALRELDVVDDGIDGREGAEHLLRLQAGRERRVALRIERLRVRHAARHPQHDHAVGGRLDLLELVGIALRVLSARTTARG